MRLWHEALIHNLPRKQLLGQHRECCALQGLGWGRKHSVVDYVFKNDPAKLVAFHWKVMLEMQERGYQVDTMWFLSSYRGKNVGIDEKFCNIKDVLKYYNISGIYQEHDVYYLWECLELLKNKGADLFDRL